MPVWVWWQALTSCVWQVNPVYMCRITDSFSFVAFHLTRIVYFLEIPKWLIISWIKWFSTWWQERRLWKPLLKNRTTFFRIFANHFICINFILHLIGPKADGYFLLSSQMASLSLSSCKTTLFTEVILFTANLHIERGFLVQSVCN